MPDAFGGAKVALFIGDKLLVTLRDDFAHIPFPSMLDFPGGGREGDESPVQTVTRETREEVGLSLDAAEVLWSGAYPSARGGRSWFFVARLPDGAEAGIVFGNEGQGWALMQPWNFVRHPRAIPSLARRLQLWLQEASIREDPRLSVSHVDLKDFKNAD